MSGQENHKMKIIYLVSGTTGEYSDTRVWEVKAFKDKKKAEAFAEACNKFAQEIHRDFPYFGCNHDNKREFIKKNSPDPQFQIDYTGTEYEVVELEFV